MLKEEIKRKKNPTKPNSGVEGVVGEVNKTAFKA